MEKVQINTWVPRSLRDSLAAEAERNMNSVSAEVRRAVAAHVERSQELVGKEQTGAGIVDAGAAARTEG